MFPSFGHSGNNGFELEVPYYFNLAPNYDLTMTPGLLSARGVQLAGEFRYLTASSHGQIDATFLPNDAQLHSDRSYFRFTDITDFKRGMRFDTDIASVSDSSYFEDFAVGSDQTSVTFLERRADLLYYDDAWRMRGELQNFQTIDITVPTACAAGSAVPAGFCDQRPYSRVPRIQANALWPVQGTNFELALDSEAVNFMREIGPDGSASERGAGNSLVEPRAGLFLRARGRLRLHAVRPEERGRRRAVRLEHADPHAALCAVDAGLVFERDAGSQGQRTQTLEPRLVYSYVPYRNQDELPIFDTGIARSEPDRTVPHQPLRGRGSHRRCEPGGPGADHATVRSRLRGTVSVGDHRPDPLFRDSRGWTFPRMRCCNPRGRPW